jgi:SPP1 gp7 family putative phage head morphogenesis protein
MDKGLLTTLSRALWGATGPVKTVPAPMIPTPHINVGKPRKPDTRPLARRLDPSHTLPIANKFSAEIGRRYGDLKSILRHVLVTENVLGIPQHGEVDSSSRVVVHAGPPDEPRVPAGQAGGGEWVGLRAVRGGKVVHYSNDELHHHIVSVFKKQGADAIFVSQFVPSVMRSMGFPETAGEFSKAHFEAADYFHQKMGELRRVAYRIDLQTQLVHPISQQDLHTHAANYPFTLDPAKLQGFTKWLKQKVKEQVFSTRQGIAPSVSHAGNFSDTYVQSAYRRGVVDAYMNTRKQAYKDEKLKGFFNTTTQEDFLRTSFASPISIDRMALLYTRTYNDLDGVTDAMSTKMSRILAQGIGDGLHPTEIANLLDDELDLGEARSRMIARTEIIRAHAEASLDTYESFGVDEVSGEAETEWLATDDDRVCEECSDMSGEIFTVDEARGMIPVHPNCFSDSEVPIRTFDGWKPIKDIQVGNYVLTHREEFQKVTFLIRSQGAAGTRMVSIYVRVGGKFVVLEVTEDHPVRVKGEWMAAKDVRVGMFLRHASPHNVRFTSRMVVQVVNWVLTEEKTLFNFSVEEDESYVAKGFVVHNCRCAWAPVIRVPSEE